MPLPTNPFDKQEFIDALRNRWVYNLETRTWQWTGAVQQIGAATETTSGLLKSIDKALIDGLPSHPGGFGLLTSYLRA